MAQKNSQQPDIRKIFECIPDNNFELEISKDICILCNLYGVTPRQIAEKFMVRTMGEIISKRTEKIAFAALVAIAKDAGLITSKKDNDV